MFHNVIYLVSLMMLPVNMFRSDSEDLPTSPDPLDEWHMDYVPTGYLPDSVYRELAWFGILQIQPLYQSTKHKVAARWVWQNTLGRPHVIMENSQTAMDKSGSPQTVLEDAAAWAREQRMAQDVLMENIKAGGNGLTVRTVISSEKKTSYIIKSGKYYTCGKDSEPDVDAFRTQVNVHEMKCTNNKRATPLLNNVDACMDAENTPLEFSFTNGWIFCLGDGERESTQFADGDVDCGKKIKMRFMDFLNECAIDSNVVISYEYYGDEPRKDMVHNTTICTSWDPCRIAYLYRLEAPNEPEVPTTTADPCDTTPCPQCVDGYKEDQYEYVVPDSDSYQTVKSDDIQQFTVRPPNKQPADDKDDGFLRWVPTTAAAFPSIKDKAIVGGFLATGERTYVARCDEAYSIVGYFVENATNARFAYHGLHCDNFEVAIAKKTHVLEWVREGDCPKENLIKSRDENARYVGRMLVEGNLLPATYNFEEKYMQTLNAEGTDFTTTLTGYEILCLVSGQEKLRYNF